MSRSVGAYLTTTLPVMEPQMPAQTKNDSTREDQTREPAKGGITPAHKDTYPYGDSPKPHGDPMRHVIEEQKKK